MSKQPYKKILVIRSSAMGDVAMTAPVLAEVSRRYPDMEMVMLTRGFYTPFFDGIPNLTIQPIDLAEQHRGLRGLFRLYKELRTKYDFDVIVDLNDKIYSKLLRQLYMLRGVHTYHIDKGRDEKKTLTRPVNKIKLQLRTSIRRYADVFGLAGLPIETPSVLPVRPIRPIPSGLGEKNGRWIGIAPFAQHRGKVYPIERMEEVISRCAERYPEARLFIFGGGASEQAVAADLDARFKTCTSVVGRFSLREELDLIANLDVMVSMDSSAMHMSSLVGIPVVSVWGATHPFAGFLGLGQSPEDVVTLDLECCPCSVYGHKECLRGDYACMTQLPPELVFRRLEKYLQ